MNMLTAQGALKNYKCTVISVKCGQVVSETREKLKCRLNADDIMRRSRLHARETQQLSWPTPLWTTPHPSVICVELLGGSSRQPMTGRLATHPSNTTVKKYRVAQKSCTFFNTPYLRDRSR